MDAMDLMGEVKNLLFILSILSMQSI